MARFAIVLSISVNQPPYRSLSACANDGAAMTAMLTEAGRFDEILLISKPALTNGASLKKQLSDFVDRQKTRRIEELVFYYSGHGTTSNGDFYFVTSDFDDLKPAGTGLSMDELDIMMRSLAPDLLIKVVDACYSGTTYVKSVDDLEAYLRRTAPSFKDVYFLFSSQGDEKSTTAAANNLGAFTKVILETIGNHEGAVRYRDLMNAATDYFMTESRQKPQFVMQANGTEVFCQASARIKAIVESYLPKQPDTPAAQVGGVVTGPLSTLDLIKAADSRYCTREETNAALITFQERILAFKLSSDITELFNQDVVAAEEEPDQAKAIGEWLRANGERNFFAEARLATEVYKKPASSAAKASRFSFTNLMQSPSQPKLLEATRDVVTGYFNTANLPYCLLKITLLPKYRVLMPIEFDIAPIVSVDAIRVFWTCRLFRPSDWDTFVPTASNLKWSSREATAKSAETLNGVADEISAVVNAHVSSLMDKKWNTRKD